MFELERFTTLEEVGDVLVEMGERSQNLFASWEWISTWWSHFGQGRRLMGTVARRAGGDPVAILPLYLFSSRPVRVLRFLGHGAGDWLGPINPPDGAELAAEALQATLAATAGWDVFLAERMRTDEPAARTLAGTVLRRESFPILPFHGRTWDALLSDRSANFRQQVRRRERQLAAKRTVTYRLCDNPGRLDADLDVLFSLHDARWAGRQSSAFARTSQSFHRDFAHRALARGWLRLWVMELDRKPVAAWYGFRRGDVELYYQSGRDRAHDRDSVGFVLLCHTIRAALEDGMEAYWFLRGNEAYKGRFAEEDPGLQTRTAARSMRGRAAVAGARIFDRLPPPARGWVVGRMG
jgi:CelD/BcsL family acetyltransferase involved in cellulose biosynthesis